MTDTSTRRPPLAPDVVDGPWDTPDKRNAVEYDPESDTYRSSFGGDAGSVCLAVVSTVAAISGTEPLALPPLYSAVDTDSLEAVAQPAIRGPANGDAHVSFTYDGYAVTVHDYGTIAVRPPEGNGGDSGGEQAAE